MAWILRLALTAPYAMISEHSSQSDCFYPKNNHDHSSRTSDKLQPRYPDFMIGSQVYSLINKRHLSLIFTLISTHKTEAHTNALHLANLRINCCCRQTRRSCDHWRKPEKNQTSDISVVHDERKGCTAVITFGVEEGKTVRGCLDYLITCALMRLGMRACVLYISVCMCVSHQPTHSHLHKPF